MNDLTTVIATLIVYQLVLLGIGYMARQRASSISGFFLAGRKLGPWVAALSYAAGSSSAWSILGVSGIAFTQGVSAVWLLPGTLLGHVVVWFVLAPRLQRQSHEHGWITLTDVLAHGERGAVSQITYLLSAFVVLFSFTFYIAAQFQGAANTFTAVFDFPFLAALLLGAGVVLLYTFWGGFWAVSVTDALQALLMFGAALVLPALAVLQVLSADTHQPTTDVYWQLLGANQGWFAVGFFIGMVSIGFGPLGQPHLLNRIMAMEKPEHIGIARTIALLWFVVVLGGMFVLGVCARMLLDAAVPGEQVFFVMLGDLLPAAVAGIFIAAVLSAIMSTADSQLLVAGAALQNDLKLSLLSPQAMARLAVVVVAAASVALALWLPEAIFSRVLFAWNALGAAFGPALVARLLGIRVQGWALPAAIATGFVATVVFYSLPNGPGDVWERAIPFLLGVVVLWSSRWAKA